MSAESEPVMRDALQQARELLSSLQSSDATQANGLPERVLKCAFQLLECVYSSIGSGKSVTLNPSDSTVVKAVLELVVRWGIYPYLSFGVGIPLEKRFGVKSAASAAAALSKHVSGDDYGSPVEHVGPRERPVQASDVVPTLLQSAELLAALILDSPQKHPSVDFSLASNINEQPSIPQGSRIEHDIPVENGESPNEEIVFRAADLRQLVMFHHLPDLCAAYIQLTKSGKIEWKKIALERLDEMVKALPVAHMVEALLTLFGQSKPDPPSWLKEKAGRMLSKLLMREGGVAATMERLVGGTPTGNVKTYEHIALHLAKVPNSVTTTQEYYKAVCPQLPPLILASLPAEEGGPEEGTSAARMVVNIHHTAIIMACKMASRDSKLCAEYLLMPLVRPLLNWGLQTTARTKLGVTTEVTQTGSSQHFDVESVNMGRGHAQLNEDLEKLLVNAVVGTQIFMTAGHVGSDCIRQFLLPLIEPLRESLSSLQLLLVPVLRVCAPKQIELEQTFYNDSRVQGSTGRGRSNEPHSSLNTRKLALEKGFLQNCSLGYATADGPISIVIRLRIAVSDIIGALHEEPMDESAVRSSVILEGVKMAWPRHDGEIWEALNSGR